MDILTILLGLIILLLVGGGVYYFRLITGFKKLIRFEQRVKKDPNDALVKQYMVLYKKTFFPKKSGILKSRAAFYAAIKASPQVSYDMKKELRIFFEKEGVNLLGSTKTSADFEAKETEEE